MIYSWTEDGRQLRKGLDEDAQEHQDAFTERLRNPETRQAAEEEVEGDVDEYKFKLSQKRESLNDTKED